MDEIRKELAKQGYTQSKDYLHVLEINQKFVLNGKIYQIVESNQLDNVTMEKIPVIKRVG